MTVLPPGDFNGGGVGSVTPPCICPAVFCPFPPSSGLRPSPSAQVRHEQPLDFACVPSDGPADALPDTVAEDLGADEVLTCRDCRREFVFSVREQRFYEEQGFQNRPSRCRLCLKLKKDQREMGVSVSACECACKCPG